MRAIRVDARRRGDGECRSCSGTSAATTSTAGPARFSTIWPLRRPARCERIGAPRSPARGDARRRAARRARPHRAGAAAPVGCDYDGTLAPLVDDPARAEPLPEAVAAVRALAALPQTTVAVVSGRALRDLATLSRLPSEVHLVGSHGSEFDLGFIQRLAPELIELHGRLLAELTRDRARRTPASASRSSRRASRCTCEQPTRRSASRRSGGRSLRARRRGPTSTSRTARTSSSSRSSRPTRERPSARCAPRRRPAPCCTSATTSPTRTSSPSSTAPTSAIKIGAGDTLAAHRVDEPIDAVRVLGFLLETRRHWLYGEHAVPIERHSMLSNGSTVALLAPDANVTWLCHPRPDSAAIFADILGGARAGYFSVAPSRQGIPLGQRYRPRNDDGRDALVGRHRDRLARGGGAGRERRRRRGALDGSQLDARSGPHRHGRRAARSSRRGPSSAR